MTSLRIQFLLLFILVLCALGVVASQHRARDLYKSLEASNKYIQYLENEYKDVERDQAMLSTQPNIERIARDKLRMAAPDVWGRHPACSPSYVRKGIGKGGVRCR